MSILADTEDLQSPSTGAATPLQGHPKLIEVNEPEKRDLEYSKRRGVIPEGVHPELDVLIQRLICLDKGLLLCDCQVLEMLGNTLIGIKHPPLRCR